MQKLIVPKGLDLTLAQEGIVADHIDVFRMNGFEFELDPVCRLAGCGPVSSVHILRMPAHASA